MANTRTRQSAVEMEKKSKSESRYSALIDAIFHDHHRAGLEEFVFDRTEVETKALQLQIKLPKNIGDAIYSFRYRSELPASIRATAIKGFEWLIFPAGKGKYRFRQFKISRIEPRADMLVTKIPDATPAIIVANKQGDEQALLAKVRYNRLIDMFLGITTYSLQNHLRTTVEILGKSQIEIDELYLGIDTHGSQYVIPVQAKGGSDRIGVVQTFQDMECCKEKFGHLLCRQVAAQFMKRDKIALFELVFGHDELLVVREKHYLLVPEVDHADLRVYNQQSSALANI
jgi:hypothetical protein